MRLSFIVYRLSLSSNVSTVPKKSTQTYPIDKFSVFFPFHRLMVYDFYHAFNVKVFKTNHIIRLYKIWAKFVKESLRKSLYECLIFI